MTLHKNKVDAALAMIAEKQLNPTDVERICGVNRTQIYRWKAGEVKDMRFNSFTKLADSLGYAVAYKNEQIEITPHTNKKGDNNMDTQILYDQVALQKEKIERLERDLEQHKTAPFQSSQWDNLEYHMYSVVEVTYTFPNIVGRTMTKLDNRDKLEHYLGYNQQEIQDLWQIGTYYKVFNDHPINAIIAKQSLKDIDKQVSTMPTLFDSLKNMIGNHYIPVPISFICKDKSIQHSVTYNKVNWLDKTVESKTQFIVDE
tara:strand:+ start:4289 stop:5062 length:774 start_codon:yes stop_codon:yes gene_type:complete